MGYHPFRAVAVLVAVLSLTATAPVNAQEGQEGSPPAPESKVESGQVGIGEPVLDDWTARQRTYETETDGVYLTELYSSPVNHLVDGEWTEIDTSLAEGGDLGLESVSSTVDVSVTPTSDEGSLASVVLPGDASVRFSLLGADQTPAVVDDSTATYEDILPNTDLQLEVLPAGLKETIVLDSPNAPSTLPVSLGLAGFVSFHGRRHRELRR